MVISEILPKHTHQVIPGLLIFGDCGASWPTSYSSSPGILTQPYFTASIILSPVTNLSKVDSLPELLPFLSLSFSIPSLLRTHKHRVLFLSNTDFIFLPSRPLMHTLCLPLTFFLTLTGTSLHLEIHQLWKAEGMKSVAVIYELL